MQKNQNVAIYVRVSTQNQVEDGYSIEAQLTKLRQYCQLNELNIIGEFVDDGVSGTKTTRSALDKLKSKLEVIDAVVVYKLDRLSRSMKDTLVLIEDVFKPNNVRLISLTENFDTGTPLGMAMVGMLSTFAQWELDVITQRMVSGKVQSVTQGNYINHAPLGYKKINKRLIKDEETQEMVTFIFQKLLEGKSLKQVADLVNAMGFKTYYSKKFLPNTIARMVNNIVYTGHTKLMKQLKENTHEAYITTEQHLEIKRLVQSRNDRSKANVITYTALFRGLIKCQRCGNKFATYRGGEKEGYKAYYYCVNCSRDGLKQKRIREEVLLPIFLEKLENFDLNIQNSKEDKEQLLEDKYKSKLNEIEMKVKKINEAWFNGALKDSEFYNFKKQLEKDKEIIETQMNELKVEVKTVDVQQITIDFLKAWDKLNLDSKHKLLKEVIDYIEITVVEAKKGRFRNSVIVDTIAFL